MIEAFEDESLKELCKSTKIYTKINIQNVNKKKRKTLKKNFYLLKKTKQKRESVKLNYSFIQYLYMKITKKCRKNYVN